MANDSKHLIEIAGHLSDGTPVDWPAEQRAAHDDDERKTILFLERVASIVRAHDRWHEQVGTHAAGETTWAAATVTATTLPPQAAPQRWGRLELRGVLGRGSFAEVHRAWDPDLGREVALKLLHTEGGRGSAEAALDEGRMLARVQHPNVVTVHGAERHDDRIGVWMELVQGRTLDALRREQGTFGSGEAALIGIDLCRALTAVHQAGLVHRDINTRNVMRADGGRIVLMDFGTGRETAEAGATMAGTPFFMAPEVLRGEAATPRSDVYAVGIVLFHLVTGTYPVRGDSLEALRDAHAQGTSTLLREARADLDAPFVRVVEKALAADPRARWASAGQMEQALSQALGAEAPASAPVVASATAPASATPPAFANRSRRLGLAVVATIPLLVLAIVRIRDNDRVPASNGQATTTLPTVVPPIAPQVPMRILASFYRRRNGVRERIEPGAAVRPGDGLALELRTAAPVHVYVVNEDERGDAHLLFPLPGFEPENPLAGDRSWVLPGTRGGTAFDWEVSSAGGRERLLVIASRERLTDLEADLLSLPRADGDAGPQYAALSSRSVERLRGIGALQERPAPVAGTQVETPGSRLDDLASRLPVGVETTPGVWVQRVEFENPR